MPEIENKGVTKASDLHLKGSNELNVAFIQARCLRQQCQATFIVNNFDLTRTDMHYETPGKVIPLCNHPLPFF